MYSKNNIAWIRVRGVGLNPRRNNYPVLLGEFYFLISQEA